MKRLSASLAAALTAGALLGLNLAASAQAATNIFSLVVDPNNTSNINALNAGDTLKLDVIFNSDNATQLFSYNASIAFNPAVFNAASSTYTFGASGFNTNPQSSKLNNTASAPYSQLFTATQAAGGTTTTFPATSVLGTYNLVVSNTATQGATNIFFTDKLPSGVPSQAARKNLLFTSSTAFFTPSFANNGLSATVVVAAVPEASTFVGFAAMLLPAFWMIRRMRALPAA